MRLPIRVALVSLIVPAAAVLVGLGLQLAWLPDLSRQIAVHWSVDGSADGFGPAWTMPLLTLVAGLGIPALFTGILMRTRAPEGLTATQKILAVASLFAGTFVAYAVTASVGIQRESADPAPIAAFLGIGAAAGLGLAVAGWFVLPRSIAGRTTLDAVPAVPLAPAEHAAWIGTARFRTGVLAALIATVAVAAGAVAFAVAVSAQWWLIAIPLLLLALLLGTTVWNVRVDDSGLTVRAALGWPRIHVPLAEVAAAGTVDLVPLGEFGGYGLRQGLGGRTGVITRSGEALEVQRRDGRAVIVTVDDAATAAGLLTALAARPVTG